MDKKIAKQEKKADEVIWTPPPDVSLAERLGTLGPLLMATGGAIAYTRFPIVQGFINSAVGQLMESLTSPENGEKLKGPQGCAQGSS